MSDLHSVWARAAFHALISRAGANGVMLDGDTAAALVANVDALKALVGASDNPQSDIVALLRSTHPIEPEVREALARALNGTAPVRFDVAGLSYGKDYRRRRALAANLERGRSTIRLMPELGYEGAIDAKANEVGVSNKTIVANVAFARKVDGWIEGKLAGGESWSALHRTQLEYIYLDAVHDSRDPDELPTPKFEARV